MRIKAAVLALAAVLCSTPSGAEDCNALFNAIKRTAAYCDFFCDQQELVPLQRAYEASCIVMYVPLAEMPFEEPWMDLVLRGAMAGEPLPTSVSASVPASTPVKFETALNLAE